MKWLTTKRIFRAGLLSFSRNAFVSFASVLVMTVTLFTVGITLFAGVILGSALQELRNKADVNVYFTQDAPEDRMLELKASLEALPEVAKVEYLSRDEALAHHHGPRQGHPRRQGGKVYTVDMNPVRSIHIKNTMYRNLLSNKAILSF